MEKNILLTFVILGFLSNKLLARGGYKPTEEEYKSWPGNNWTTKIGDDWVVPSIIGINFDTEKERFDSRMGLFKISRVKRVYNRSEKGKIISQVPKGGILVKTVGNLEITVSNGRD
ncbi:MAG: hypothetical protein EOP07_04260 [Proteobacteria bacterium]|nr:MAG: hypothetical protein EOP07_04260 [Pseudomonadota bacterium]